MAEGHTFRFLFHDVAAYRKSQPLLDRIIRTYINRDDGHFILGVNEAISNALIYGKTSESAEAVRVVVKTPPGRVIVRVRDGGAGFDWRARIAALDKSINASAREMAGLTERGRGILVMCRSCDVLRFNRLGNEVLLARKHSIEGRGGSRYGFSSYTELMVGG